MKKLVYFFLVVLVAIGSCKPKCEYDCLNGGTCVNGVCVCANNFTSVNCRIEIIPIDSFVGDYSMVSNGGWSGIMTVTKVNESTLNVYGKDLIYTRIDGDTFSRYLFYSNVGLASASTDLVFLKPFNDSAFYDASSGGHFPTYTSIRGVKIH